MTPSQTAEPSTTQAPPGSAHAFGRLRAANLILAVLHAAQAGIILAISADFALPVNASFLEGPPGSALPQPESLFDLNIGVAVAIFLGLAAVDHLLVASPGVVTWYEANLRRGINYARWIEYSLSVSLMVVLIAMLTGVADVRALIAIAGVNAAMILFGLVMERVNPDRSRVDWLPFWLGCIAGAVPWIAITISLIGSAQNGDVPGFVYGIFVSLFILFNSFAVNMWLQYRQIGPWRNYRFGEWGYLTLSLVAKSALAWQVYAGALAS